MKRLRRLFRNSIAKTMLGGFLLVIVPTLALGLIANAVSVDVASNEISASYANSITLLSQQMADRLYNMDMLAAAAQLDDDLITLSNSGKDSVDLYNYVQFQERLLLYRTPKLIDTNMVIGLPKQRWLIGTNTGIMKMEDTEKFTNLSSLEGWDTLWSIQQSVINPKEECLSVIRGYVHPRQSSPFVLMEISRNEMKKVLDTMSKDTALHTFFLDPLGNYFSTGNDLDADFMEQLKIPLAESDADESNQHRFQYQGKTYRLLYQTVGSYNCKIGMLFDEAELLRPVVNMRVFFVIFMFFAVTASLAFVLFNYRQILTPVRSLTAAMLELESGNLNARVEIAHKNELTVMSRQFNRMASQLDNLIKESYVKELKLKNAQLRFLRSQINPHFLYNSLFSVYNMIQSGDLDSASNMAVYLGKYYQISAHLHDRELTLSEELENIKMYTQIMAIRFPERLRLVVEVESDTATLKIPVLSLQTVVENAILHGMEGSVRECVITICARLSGNTLSLSVTDTGNGISEEELVRIRERLSHAVEIEDKHGLENVYMRLKLMYGEEVSMEVSNRAPTGTIVEIQIPLKEEKEDVQLTAGG